MSYPINYKNFGKNRKIAREILNDVALNSLFDYEFLMGFFSGLKKRDKEVFIQALKQVKKIFINPEKIGKHLGGNRSGQKEVYVYKRTYRLYFEYSKKENKITFREFSHKDNQKDYKKEKDSKNKSKNSSTKKSKKKGNSKKKTKKSRKKSR